MDNKFYVGQRVKCPLFGKGEVTAINKLGTFQVQVTFDNLMLTPKDYMADGRLYPNFLPTLEPDEPEVIEWPEGANYLATDENGAQCFYGSLPFINEETKEWNQGVSGFFDYKGIKCKNWRESLIKREQ